jgi:cytidyltransferase-like protein
MKVILATGGFDPLHIGHIAYFKEASKLGDLLVVGVNSDEWLTRKKGQPFMSIHERVEIVANLSMVDSVITFDDSDGGASRAIHKCLEDYPTADIVFANGGDRTDSNIPEMKIRDPRLSFVFGVGGTHKMNSSSRILTEWKNSRTKRVWGYYRVLHSDGPSTKVKELIVAPGKSLSLQRHELRSEYWIVSHGIAAVNHGESLDNIQTSILEKHDEINIPAHTWHQLRNNTNEDLRIVEIQYGKNCIEEDIERIDSIILNR